MNARSLAAFLDALDPGEEVAVEVVFPELGGWRVDGWSYTVGFDPDEGWPLLSVSVYGADFDYPGALEP